MHFILHTLQQTETALLIYHKTV